jgi:murein DD-endopeptidase MepM/ murein hydrolase activator NlpD
MKVHNNFYGNYKIEELKKRNDPDAIKDIAKEMESLFAYELIKAMRKTTSLSKGSLGQDIYMSMFDLEIARLFVERGLGLQDLIMKNLQKYDNYQPESEDKARLTEDISSFENIPTGLPVSGLISSHYGMRKHPIYGDMRFHSGIDIAAEEGTPVFSVMKGRVIFSGEMAGYGNTIIIDHMNGYKTLYAHNKINLVKEGDEVNPGMIIAEVGSSGNSTGPHLHFEVRYNDKNMDPAIFLAKRG